MPKPQPPNSDQLLAQLQAYVDSVVAAAMSVLGIDAIRSRLDSLEVRTLALEEATPGAEVPGEVHWRSAKVKLLAIKSGTSVSASWQRIGTTAPSSVTLALDDGPSAVAQENESLSWDNVPAGTHYVVARVNGVEEARDTFSI